MAELKSAA